MSPNKSNRLRLQVQRLLVLRVKEHTIRLPTGLRLTRRTPLYKERPTRLTASVHMTTLRQPNRKNVRAWNGHPSSRLCICLHTVISVLGPPDSLGHATRVPISVIRGSVYCAASLSYQCYQSLPALALLPACTHPALLSRTHSFREEDSREPAP